MNEMGDPCQAECVRLADQAHRNQDKAGKPHAFSPGRDGAVCAVCGEGYAYHARYRRQIVGDEPIRELSPAASVDTEWLTRLADAAEQMRIAYNRALEKHGGTNPVLRDLRWAIGHLAATREAAIYAKLREVGR